MRRLLEGGVIRGGIFSKIKMEAKEIMCQFKAIRYFLNHAV